MFVLLFLLLPIAIADMPSIMYGSTTPPHYDAPWFVHIRQIKNHKLNRCSGSLIAQSIIITAAHCLVGAEPSGLSVFAGVAAGENLEQGVERKVHSFAIHPNYLNKGMISDQAYDFAIVVLESPFLPTDRISTLRFPVLPVVEGTMVTATIPPDSEPIYPIDRWRHCQVAGSGQTFDKNENCVQSETRRFMSGLLFGQRCCDALMRFGEGEQLKVPFGTFCFFNTTDAACAGDSGSGVTCLSPTDGSPALVGVLVAGNQCCDSTGKKLNSPTPRILVPMDYARRHWIYRQIKHFNNNGFLIGNPAPTTTTTASTRTFDSFTSAFERIDDMDFM